MTDAPRTIWANVAISGDGKPLAGEWNHCDVGSPEDHRYHHDDVVRELREAALPIAALSYDAGPQHAFVTVPVEHVDTLRAAVARLDALTPPAATDTADAPTDPSRSP